MAVIHRGNWMDFMDLENAYFHIPVAKVHQHFLRFVYADNHFQFRCLSFGPSLAPKTFTKVLVMVIAYLRQRGIRIFHYLDNVRILAQSINLFLQHQDQVLATLNQFGWMVNTEKKPSHSVPSLGLFGQAFQHAPIQGIPCQNQDGSHFIRSLGN